MEFFKCALCSLEDRAMNDWLKEKWVADGILVGFWLVWGIVAAYYARAEPVTSCIGQNMPPLTTSWLLTYSLPSCCISPLCFFIHFCLRWKFWGRLFFPGSILREINRDHSSQALALSKGARREPLIDWDEDDWGLWVGWLVWWHGTLFGPQQALGEVVGGTPITGFDAIEFLPKSKISQIPTVAHNM